VRAAQGVAASAAYVGLHGEGHAMLRRAGMWHELTTAYVLATLFGVPPGQSVRDPAANVVARALAGNTALEV
jgi:hypothetical protein